MLLYVKTSIGLVARPVNGVKDVAQGLLSRWGLIRLLQDLYSVLQDLTFTGCRVYLVDPKQKRYKAGYKAVQG